MLKLIIRSKNIKYVTGCANCEEAYSITCESCHYNKEKSYICPNCRRECRIWQIPMAINNKIICSECYRNISDVISLSEDRKGRMRYHLGAHDSGLL